jgi:mono/diheme cytochrome c family protein
MGVMLLLAAGGCREPEPDAYVSSDRVLARAVAQQDIVRRELARLCGTPADPQLLGGQASQAEQWRRGSAVYARRCASCHGTSGDGAGPAALYLVPRPRDYRRGIFKFTSTSYGRKPLREDLVRVVRQGAPGTAMPSFALLSEEEAQAVVDYVLVLTHRGELEEALAAHFEVEDELPAELLGELTAAILGQWAQAPQYVVRPLSAEPPRTAATIAAGKAAFFTETAGCVKCHGEDGRGRVVELADSQRDPKQPLARAADLTSGMFHGGGEPLDLYRRIFAGINGTPMPEFALKLQDQPETFWHLVHFVQELGQERRRRTLAAEQAWLLRATPRVPAGAAR